MIKKSYSTAVVGLLFGTAAVVKTTGCHDYDNDSGYSDYSDSSYYDYSPYSDYYYSYDDYYDYYYNYVDYYYSP